MKFIRLSLPVLFSLFLLLGTLSCATSPKVSDSSPDSSSPELNPAVTPKLRIYSSAEQITQPDIITERGKVNFITDPAGARLFINGKSIGSTPLLYPLPDGSYHIRIAKQRYHSTDFYLEIQNDNIAAVQVLLEPHTGKIAPVISPEDAVVTSNNMRMRSFPLELPVGTYTLQVSRFGYKPNRTEVKIRRDETAQPKIKLEPLPFTVQEISISPETIRIIPPLAPRELVIKGSVSAPGNIKITIRNRQDIPLRSELIELSNSPYFEKRYRLQPGSYRIIVQGSADTIQKTTVYEQRVEVLKEEPISLFTTGLPATLAVIGVPRATSVGVEIVQSSFSLGGGGRIEASPVLFPAQLSVAAGLPYSLEVQTSAGLLIEKSRTTMLSGSVQLKRELFTTGNTARLSGAFEFFGTYLSDRDIPEASAFLLPFETAVGSRPIFEFTLHPDNDRFLGVSLSPSVELQVNKTDDEKWMGRLHGGAFLQIKNKAVALTTKTNTELHHFGYAVEISWLIPQSSMHLNLFAGGISEDELLSYYTSGITFYYIR